MATRVTDGARREMALVSRVLPLRRSRARALLSLNLKKKRDRSQSSVHQGGCSNYTGQLFAAQRKNIRYGVYMPQLFS